MSSLELFLTSCCHSSFTVCVTYIIMIIITTPIALKPLLIFLYILYIGAITFCTKNNVIMGKVNIATDVYKKKLKTPAFCFMHIICMLFPHISALVLTHMSYSFFAPVFFYDTLLLLRFNKPSFYTCAHAAHAYLDF